MSKTVTRTIRDVPQHWVGDGFPVRSLFSYRSAPEFDPFLLLDYAGPHVFEPTDERRGVGEHPHRGFETVTILFSGALEHRDSSGGHGRLDAGDVQWMTAAAGLVHEEFHAREFAETGGELEMIQLWVNLRAADKQAPPRYQDLRDAGFPRVPLPNDAGTVRVIAGDCDGTAGPAKAFSPLNLWDVELTGGDATLSIPEDHSCLVVAQSGRTTVGGETLARGELVSLSREGTEFTLSTDAPARVVVLTGEPLAEPVVGQGPYVMNTREEIERAIRDYREGRLGALPTTDN